MASLESSDTRGSMEIPEVLESLPPLARLRMWDEEHLRAALRFANAAGALATTRKGAIPALATAEEIHILMQKEAVR
ncbi:hypothetical protein EJQ19_26640 [Paenibacillus whitsoniae]|uniref:Carbohydrate kinase PfkB domain-containing protein n=1 Tax=Paenibacillus whitsoniae TaxID=2496558 RepID=A0A430J6Y7_9BACL|nr:hypothetical protein EJQ19_26640 [Paenibacillus whitsoniae]